MKNLISVIIVNYNGKKWLKKCFDSLYAQTYKNFEIIFVDNASEDDSVEFVKNNFPEVIVIKNKKNLGFATGNNIGVKKAKGEYIFILNNDTFLARDCLVKLIESFDEIPNLGSVQPKIVLMKNPNKLDACGAYWTDFSFLYHYGYGKKASLKKYNKPRPFFSNKGVAMMIRKDLINKIGLFDDDFWCYYEETDFCNRVWLFGYECWYYPEALVYHVLGGTNVRFQNAYVQFHNFKNKLLSFLKNFECKTLFKIIPVYLFLNFILSIAWLLQGKFKHFLALYKAIGWNIINIRKTLKKRKIIQSFRKKTDKEIFSQAKKNPSLSYYYYLFTSKLERYKDVI